MTRGPYNSDGPAGERTPGRITGYRTWTTLACLNGMHRACTDGGHRCDCDCHVAEMRTGAWIYGIEPA